MTMLALFLATVTPPSVPPLTTPDAESSSSFFGGGVGSSMSDVATEMWDNVTNNGYQTAVAVVVATIAIVAMVNIKVNPLILVPVGLGAFWAGWLGWNTITGDDNPLFPGDVSATTLWDLASSGDRGFLVVAVVAGLAAVALWRTSTGLISRIMLIAGAVLGSSFVYNLYEAVRDS